MSARPTRRPVAQAALSWRALNRATLARQSLLARSPVSPLAMIEQLVGLQSQAPEPPYFGLWTRLERFAPAELADLIEKRRAVRLALMRSTLHLVSAADAPFVRALLQPAVARPFASLWNHQLAGVDVDRLLALGRDLLGERPLTFARLGAGLALHFPGRDAAALAQALRAHAALVQVPPRGLWRQSGAAAHTLLETWVGRGTDSPPGIPYRLERLLERYLGAFGPASVRDAQAWSGLTRLGPVFESMRSSLLSLRGPEGEELFDLPGAPRPDADAVAPPRFLGEWENLLLSYADRRRVVDPQYAPRVFTRNGQVFATILVDGFVRGAWRLERSGNRCTLAIRPFRRLGRDQRGALLDEGERLLRFAAPEVDGADIRIAAVVSAA